MLCAPVLLSAQDKGLKFQFEKLPSEIGFPNSGVNDIVEDHLGFLWIATWAGLAKYDGYSVKMYRQQPGNTNGIKSNKITEIFEDSKGTLWIGTSYSGFYRYDREQDTFRQFCRDPKDMNSLSNDNVSSILEDKDGIFWIGTERGLNRFDPETGNYIHYLNEPTDTRSLSHDFVYSLAQTDDGSIWVGTEEGLNRLVKKDDEEYFIRYDLAPPGTVDEIYLSHNFIFKIIPSKFHQDVFWICTSIGLKKIHYSATDPVYLEYDYYGHEIANPNSLIHPFVSDILEENSSLVWISTYNGVNLLNTNTGQNRCFNSVKNDPNSLSNNVVMSLSKDRTNNLWIGLDKGVNKLNLNARAFQLIHPETRDNTGSSITCIIPSGNRPGVWVGSRGGGLNYLAFDANNNLTSFSRNYHFDVSKMQDLSGFVFDLLLDKDGWLWVATDGAGVIRIKEDQIPKEGGVVKNLQQFTTSDQQLSDNYVMSLLQSTSGDIWLGYWDKGLDRYDAASGTFYHYFLTRNLDINFQLYPIVHIIETIENGQAFLWVGTRGGGLYKLKFNEIANGLELVDWFRSEGGQEGNLSNDFINDFFIDARDQLWVGTDNGLNLLDSKTGKFTSFYEEDGLNSGTIQSILQDFSGKIWVSTQQGISCLNFVEGKMTPKNFDGFNGLQDNYYNDDASYITDSGQLIFGGVNGLSAFNPDNIHLDTIAPMIVISDFKLSNRSVAIGEQRNGKVILTKSISETRELKLSHKEKVVSFEFTGLHFGEPEKIQYAYQLVGFDPDWVYTDASQRTAHYTNLPYKEFVFMVKAANGDGAWSDPVELILVINPPFWLTGWAYILYGLVAAWMIYIGIRLTKLRAEFRHNLELERVEREKLEEVNWLKLQFFTNLSHEFRTPLTLIISPLEQFLQQPKDKKMHQIFSRMYYNANRLLTLINQLLDIRKNEAGLMNLHVGEKDLVELSKEITLSFKYLANQRNIKLTFDSDSRKILAWIDHEQLEKVLFNLLSNAFKFTKDGGSISVDIQENDFIYLSVSDTGMGIPANELEHIFERFYQVEKNIDRSRRGGTGIGLSLAKMIVEKHHGIIEVESTEGVGTTFRIKMLKGKDHFSDSELFPGEKEDITNSTSGFVFPEPHAELAEISVEMEKSKNGSNNKPGILIVEDNPDVRAYLRENLEQDYKISEASDGQEGLEKALAEPPALILADIAMPRMDGIEMCARIKSNIVTCHVPVILLTARTSLIFKVDGLETGADDYVTKPFHMRLLITRIKNLIDSRNVLREHFAKNFDLSPSGVVLNSMDEKLLSQIKIVVEKHIDDSDFSVDQLASALQMSRMQLYRKLKSLTGKSPNHIIRSFRLLRAAQLLESGQYNVSDVTYLVGYNDLKSFRDQFKKEFGMSPSRYNK